MPSRRITRTHVVFIMAALFVAAAFGIYQIDILLRDVHPQNITRALAQWEIDYRHVGDQGASHHRGMLEYVENHYRYEDMPEYRDVPVANELAAQRQRTLNAIRAGLEEFEAKRQAPDLEADANSSPP